MLLGSAEREAGYAKTWPDAPVNKERPMSIGVKRAMSDQQSKQAEVVPSPADQPAERGQRGRRRHRNKPRQLDASINMKEAREMIDVIT